MSIKLRKIILLVAIAMTLISQMPLIRVSGGIDPQIFAYPSWIIVFLLSLTKERKIILPRKSIPLFSLSILFVLLILLFSIFTQNDYFTSLNTLSFCIAIFMSFIGVLNSDLFDLELFKKIEVVYIIFTLLICVSVYLDYYQGIDFSTFNYIFKSKNSVGQIAITAIILLLYMNCSKALTKIIKWTMVIIISYFILLMRSRATIVSFLLIPMIYTYSKNVKIKYKLLVATMVVFLAMIVLTDNRMYALFIDNILFGSSSSVNLAQLDIEKISSTRYSSILTALDIFNDHELCGIGSYYVDNFFVASIINYGVVAGVIYIIIAFEPLRLIHSINDNGNIKIILYTIAAVYIFNGLFEGLAPFGPGTKCFFLWLLTGALCLKNKDEFAKKSL